MISSIASTYDVIVAGAGPAGLAAGYAAALNGKKVLIVDRKREIGHPVRCGEVVNLPSLLPELPISESLIRKSYKELEFFFGRNHSFVINLANFGVNLVQLDRLKLEKALAYSAEELNAQLVLGTAVSGLLQQDGVVRGVQLSDSSGSKEVHSKMVIAADGVESRVARWAELTRELRRKELALSLEVRVTRVNLNPDRLISIWDRDCIPPGSRGYGWIFPRDRGKANCGIGFITTRREPVKVRDYFIRLGEQYIGTYQVESEISGGIPQAAPIKTPYGNGILVTGDAARFVSRLTGDGLNKALNSGYRAGLTAAEAISQNRTDKAFLSSYRRLSRQTYSDLTIAGRYERLFHTLISDPSFLSYVNRLNALSPESITPIRMLSKLILFKPSLLFHLLFPPKS